MRRFSDRSISQSKFHELDLFRLNPLECGEDHLVVRSLGLSVQWNPSVNLKEAALKRGAKFC